MTIKDALLREFDFEMEKARTTLERVPDDKLGWKPHAKSGTMGWLAGHLAEVPGWTSVALQQDSFDLAPPGAPEYQPRIPGSRQEILDTFDKNVAAARAALASASDTQLQQKWTLRKGGQEIFSMPRAVVLRNFVMNHLIHHRAQLGVYLRLNDIPVPSIYGPSADEQPF
jgi:uncharacterized damage-inducible protein DinB